MQKIRGRRKPEGFGEMISNRASKKIVCTNIITEDIRIFESGKIAVGELGVTIQTLIIQLQKAGIWRGK